MEEQSLDNMTASTSSTVASNHPESIELIADESPDDEIKLLMQHVDDDPAPLTESTKAAVRASLKKTLSGTIIEESGEASYGRALTIEKASERMPPEEGGFKWQAIIVPDKFIIEGKLLRGLKPRDFDLERKAIKPRRATPPVFLSDLVSSLTKVGHRYIFYGVLNGWPALRCLELVAVEQKRQIPGWKEVWSVDDEGARGIPLTFPDRNQIYRATLRGAPWTSHGWSKDSPGFVFWYEAQRREGPRITYGTNILKKVDDGKCTHIHMVAHRYAVKRESPKDLLTYHSVCLLEWDHGQYMTGTSALVIAVYTSNLSSQQIVSTFSRSTVVETAFLNGIGGYYGRSNWYHDRDAQPATLFKVMPPEMISPWRSNSAGTRRL